MGAWSERGVQKMLVNPIYAISLSEALCIEHPPLVPRQQWISANKRLIEEMGAEAWLETLLEVLEGGYVADPE